MISLSQLVSVVVYLICAGLVAWLLLWLIACTNPPEPFRKVATVIVAVLSVLFVIGVLVNLVGGVPIFRS